MEIIVEETVSVRGVSNFTLCRAGPLGVWYGEQVTCVRILRS